MMLIRVPRSEFQHVAGTRAQLDFVETPSTLMEYFAYSPAVLAKFARHWRTGEPIPGAELAALKVPFIPHPPPNSNRLTRAARPRHAAQ